MDKTYAHAAWLILLPIAVLADTSIEVGPTFVAKTNFSHAATVILQERWGDYAVGVGYISEQELEFCDHHPLCKWPVQQQLLVGVERVFGSKLELAIGPYWFQNKNRIMSCNLNMRLSIGMKLTNRLGVKFSHFSNAGTCSETTINNPWGQPVTKRFNMGQDAILLTWRF